MVLPFFIPTQSQRLIPVFYPNRNYCFYFHGRFHFVLIKNDYLPRNIHNPIAMKARAATFLRIFWGMTAIRPSPKRTPTSVTRHKARDAPMNTDKGSFVLEVIMMAANCVLSPSSARKIVPKVVRKTFQSIALPLQSYLVSFLIFYRLSYFIFQMVSAGVSSKIIPLESRPFRISSAPFQFFSFLARFLASISLRISSSARFNLFKPSFFCSFR